MAQLALEHGIPVPTTFSYPGYATSPAATVVLRERGYRFARAGGARVFDPGLSIKGRKADFPAAYFEMAIVISFGQIERRWEVDAQAVILGSVVYLGADVDAGDPWDERDGGTYVYLLAGDKQEQVIISLV